MRIKWYGTASIMLEGGDTRILVDPYLKASNPALPPFPLREAAAADACVVTHPHFDHFADIGAVIAAGLRAVYVPEAGIALAERNAIPTDAMTPVAVNRQVRIGGISVNFYQGRHCKFDAGTVFSALSRLKRPSDWKKAAALLRENRRFRIAAEDILAVEFCHAGQRVLVLGSAGMDADTEYPTGVDMLVFPCQGRRNMQKYIMPFMETFRPKTLFFDHFDDAMPPVTETVALPPIVSAVAERFPEVKCVIPREGEWYEI